VTGSGTSSTDLFKVKKEETGMIEGPHVPPNPAALADTDQSDEGLKGNWPEEVEFNNQSFGCCIRPIHLKEQRQIVNDANKSTGDDQGDVLFDTDTYACKPVNAEETAVSKPPMAVVFNPQDFVIEEEFEL
jgi:hypothetical protein